MKKILTFGLGLVALFMMASCSSPATPGKAFTQYVDVLKSGNYEKFVDGFALEEGVSQEQAQQQKAMMASLISEKAGQEFDSKGGIKGVEIISEEISEDGNNAVVTFKLQFGDGSEMEDSQDMVLRDGKWLVDANK